MQFRIIGQDVFALPGSRFREPGEGGKNPHNDLCPRFPPSLPARRAEERRGFMKRGPVNGRVRTGSGEGGRTGE
jgi:hypothetical protein